MITHLHDLQVVPILGGFPFFPSCSSPKNRLQNKKVASFKGTRPTDFSQPLPTRWKTCNVDPSGGSVLFEAAFNGIPVMDGMMEWWTYLKGPKFGNWTVYFSEKPPKPRHLTWLNFRSKEIPFAFEGKKLVKSGDFSLLMSHRASSGNPKLEHLGGVDIHLCNLYLIQRFCVHIRSEIITHVRRIKQVHIFYICISIQWTRQSSRI